MPKCGNGRNGEGQMSSHKSLCPHDRTGAKHHHRRRRGDSRHRERNRALAFEAPGPILTSRARRPTSRLYRSAPSSGTASGKYAQVTTAPNIVCGPVNMRELVQSRKELDVSMWSLLHLIRVGRAWGTGPLSGPSGHGRGRRARAGWPAAPAHAGWDSALPCLRFAVARRPSPVAAGDGTWFVADRRAGAGKRLKHRP